MKIFRGSSKGQVIVVVVFSIMVLLAFVGLSLDVGRAYGVRAKLYAAVDAAAIAGGKAALVGTDDDTRKANARTAATNAFNANFTNGYMGSAIPAGSGVTTTPVHNANGTWTVTVDAARTVPTYLAKLVGWATFTVQAHSQSGVRNLDMVLVLDCSSSLASSGSFEALRSAAISFVDKFQAGAGGDRVAVVAFGTGAQRLYGLNQDYNWTTRGFNKTNLEASMNSTNLPAPSATGNQTYTASSEGIRRALYELDRCPAINRSTLRVIVFFSDGEPNTFAGRFNNGGTIKDGTLISAYMNRLGNALTLSAVPTTVSSITRLDTYTISPAYTFDYSNITGIAIPPASTDPLSEYVTLQSYDTATNTRRTLDKIGSNITYNQCNTDKIARNMVENVAQYARCGSINQAACSTDGTQIVTVYSIGLGNLGAPSMSCSGYNALESGQNVMKRLANTVDSDTYHPSQPTGLYINAPTAADLESAFTKVRQQMLRLAQ